MCCSQHSVIHQKPPALRLPVPSATHSCQGIPSFIRDTCPQEALSFTQPRFSGLVWFAQQHPRPSHWCVQQGGHSRDIERCAKLLPSPAWGTQICYPRNYLQSSAEGNPGNSVVPAVSKDADGGWSLPGSASSTRRGICSHAKQPGNETLLQMPAAVTPTWGRCRCSHWE